VAATNRSEEGLDIPKSRKNLISYTDLMSWIVRCTRYKVQSTELEIHGKYDRNRLRFASWNK
jgi:hypothetical protein